MIAPRLRTVRIAIGMLLIGAAPVALYLGQQSAARRLGAALSESLGLPVSVNAFWGGASPSIVIAGLSLGGDRPFLTIDRTEVQFELRLTLRPRVRSVRLLRPVLHLSDDRLWNWLAQRSSAQPGSPRQAARSASSPWLAEFFIDDGAVRIDHLWRRHRLSARIAGISLRSGPPARLILGATQLSSDGEVLVDAAAVALDLDRQRSWRPIRAALLAGSVRAPGVDPVKLHSLTLTADSDGYRLHATAKPAGQDTGRITCRGRLDQHFLPTASEGIEINVRQVSISRLAAPLERLGLRLQRARLSGRLWLALQDHQLRIQTNLSADDLQVQHPVIARQPVGPFSGELHGEGALDLQSGEIQLETLRLGTSGVELRLHGQAKLERGRSRFALETQLPATPCQKLLLALPPGLAPALAGMGVSGELGLTASFRFDTNNLEAAEANFSLAPLTCRVVAEPPRADVRKLLGPLAIQVADGSGTGREWLLGARNPDYRPLSRISPHLRQAFVVAEDSQFWTHQGFDAKQLHRAFINNLKEGRLARGASTISQQLIKNVFLGHERTFARKLQETVLTWRLEQVVPKSRILELYLNLVEMGPDIYGVAQAARTYFKEDAAWLGPAEAAQLAALTPSPRHLAPRLREGNPGNALRERVQLLLRMMRRRSSAAARPPVPAGERVSLLPTARE